MGKNLKADVLKPNDNHLKKFASLCPNHGAEMKRILKRYVEKTGIPPDEAIHQFELAITDQNGDIDKVMKLCNYGEKRLVH